jgi:hypothetical protein
MALKLLAQVNRQKIYRDIVISYRNYHIIGIRLLQLMREALKP